MSTSSSSFKFYQVRYDDCYRQVHRLQTLKHTCFVFIMISLATVLIGLTFYISTPPTAAFVGERSSLAMTSGAISMGLFFVAWITIDFAATLLKVQTDKSVFAAPGLTEAERQHIIETSMR